MPSWFSTTVAAVYLRREEVVRALRATARRLVESAPDVHAVVLFGSLARGGGGPGSDADLLILLASSPHPLRRDRIPDLLAGFGPVPVPLDLHAYTVAEYGAALRAGDPFFAAVLTRCVVLAGELPENTGLSPAAAGATTGTNGPAPDRTIDLRGEVCPTTYVRTKLTLEEMAAGRILRVVLDHPPAFLRVPRSAAEEGHRVLSRTERPDGTFEVLIEKCGE